MVLGSLPQQGWREGESKGHSDGGAGARSDKDTHLASLGVPHKARPGSGWTGRVLGRPSQPHLNVKNTLGGFAELVCTAWASTVLDQWWAVQMPPQTWADPPAFCRPSLGGGPSPPHPAVAPFTCRAH